MKDPACFVYFFKGTGMACAFDSRNDLNGELLFTCPESWLPKDQATFEDAARYYGVKHPQYMRYDGNLVPF